MCFNKKETFTLIARFDQAGYDKLDSILSLIDEKVCRVPYCRVLDSERYAVDNLPYHITVSSSKQSQKDILEALKPLLFNPFDVVVTGVEIMSGKKNSQVLFFMIQDSAGFDNLQLSVYNCLRNENYLPGNNTPHITIAISRNHDKIKRIKSAIESDFKPFVLTIDSLGLYRIWPGEFIREFQGKA